MGNKNSPSITNEDLSTLNSLDKEIEDNVMDKGQQYSGASDRYGSDNNSKYKISLIEDILNLSPIDFFTFERIVFEEFEEYDALSMLRSDIDFLIMQSQRIKVHRWRSTTPVDSRIDTDQEISNDQCIEASEETSCLVPKIYMDTNKPMVKYQCLEFKYQ